MGNSIDRTSLTGPLLYFEGTKNKTDQRIVIAFNNLSYVHGYSSANFAQIVRYFYGLDYDPDDPTTANIDLSDYDSDAYLANYYRLMTFGGGVLVQGNTFSHIVGCPSVDTGLISFKIATKVNIDTSNKGYKRNLIQPFNQFLNNIYLTQNPGPLN